jgi:streptomycin 6-kinase
MGWVTRFDPWRDRWQLKIDGRERGWLAIDPKGLLGERTFDYTNIFCNPDLETATAPTVFSRRLDVVADVSKIDREVRVR